MSCNGYCGYIFIGSNVWGEFHKQVQSYLWNSPQLTKQLMIFKNERHVYVFCEIFINFVCILHTSRLTTKYVYILKNIWLMDK